MITSDSQERPNGDPEGRRLALRRAAELAEAGRVVAALQALLRRSNLDTAGLVDDLARSVGNAEQAELMRANGRIEPRKRFAANGSNPLRDRRPIDLLSVDESGRSYIQVADESPSWFAIGAVAMLEVDAETYQRRADELKVHFFGTSDMTFHEPDMRNHDGPFYLKGDTSEQARFEAQLNQLLDETPFTVFGTCVRKNAFHTDFVSSGIDPYLPLDAYSIAIQMLLERYLDYLASREDHPKGRVTFEGQGPREDAEHQRDYVDVLLNGTQWISNKSFQSYLETGVRFVPKQGSHPVEIADMVSRDLYEWVRSGCTSTPQRWELFSKRAYRRGDRRMGKFGIKVFPDSDIRDVIENHRDSS